MKRAFPVTIIIITLSIVLPDIPASGEEAVTDFTPHGMIKIHGETDLTEENGVTGGSGTGSDPFIIEGWWVNVTQGPGILIENTDSHILLRGIAVTRYPLNSTETNVTDIGIEIINCSNIRMERCYVYYFDTGLDIKGSTDIHLLSSSFIENHDGVLMESHNSSVTGCICSYNTRYGLKVADSEGIVVKDVLSDANSFTMGEGSGLEFANCSDVVIGECYGTLNYGGHINVLGPGRDLLIEDCYSESNVFGILVTEMDHVSIINSSIKGNTYGINLGEVSDSLIMDNYIYKNTYGLMGYVLSRSMIAGCEFEYNENGVTLDSSWENLFVENYFFRSSREAVLVVSSTAVADTNRPGIFTMNEFIENNGERKQVRDPTGTVEWSLRGRGNYWSDWQGNDTDRDGIVDRPMEISGGTRDDHPLKDEIAVTNIETTEKEDRSPEYWIIVFLSTLATLMLGFIILYNRRSSGP